MGKVSKERKKVKEELSKAKQQETDEGRGKPWWHVKSWNDISSIVTIPTLIVVVVGIIISVNNLKISADNLKISADNSKISAYNSEISADSLKISADSLKISADNAKISADSLKVNEKLMELAYRPVVFIRESIPPVDGSVDAIKHSFVLASGGSIPAREVTCECKISEIAGTNKVIDVIFSYPVNGKITIYPGMWIVFNIPELIKFSQPVTQAEAEFSIHYKSDIEKDKVYTETMKWVFSPETGNKWVYVGPEISLGIK